MAFVLCSGHHLFILLRPPCCASSQQHTLAKLWGLGSHDLLAHRLTSQTFKQERCLTCSLKKTQQANKGSSGPEVSMSGSPCVFSLLCCLYKIHTLSFSLCQSETAMAEKQLLAAQRDDKERLLLLPPLPRLCALVSGEKTFSISDVKYSTIYLFWVAVCFSFLVFFFSFNANYSMLSTSIRNKWPQHYSCCLPPLSLRLPQTRPICKRRLFSSTCARRRRRRSSP